MKIIKNNNLIQADLHTHTIMSGHAFNTGLEMIREAKKKGIKILGLTEHGPTVSGAMTSYWYFRNCGKNFPRTIEGIKVLYGVEVNIINEKGELDVPATALEVLDIVIAALHQECMNNYQKDKDYTGVLIKAMKNPLVNMISHPYNKDFKINFIKLAEAASKYNKLLEINTSYIYKQENNPEEIAGMKGMIKQMQARKMKTIINSDAYIFTQLGCSQEVWKKLKDLRLREEDIINNNQKELKKYFNKI